ncbi:outer membrane protein [Xanthobacter versatilis]|uniref:outer membrane protein n=1 Tax=Xanthobacter autotrophicus (strain ATCC BAA-1158 / Py2) TaxID=78245 RepID=UPI00372C7EF2
MRSYFVAVFAASVMSGAACAADLAVAVTKAPPAPASFSWTGFYIGGNAGYAWNSGALDGVGYIYGSDYGSYSNGWFNGQRSSGSNSFTGGAQAGYNYQIGRAVLGFEADINYADVRKTYAASSTYDLYPYPVDRPDYNYHLREQLDASASVEWFGTIRARLGVTALDRLLVYATGGAAYGKVSGSGSYSWREYGFWWGGPGDHAFDRSGGFGGTDSSVRWGWTVGGGLEYAITDNITVKGEYLYVDLGSNDYRIPEAIGGDEFVTWTSSTKLNVARLGVNYKF